MRITKILISLLLLSFLPLLSTRANAAEPLPNILWISIEDTGPELGPYSDKLARTPHLDRFAAEGTVFLNAFSHAPVCGPTRSGIITGMYPTSIGTHHMRSDKVPPAYVKAFPEYLRAAGYYCTNNSKTDYNFPAPLTAWDENGNQAHWKNRPDKEQPFFAVFNLTSSHEGSVRRQFAARNKDASNKIHDANELILPPYYPDTPKVREAWAAYYDVVTKTDETIGQLLQELTDAGLAENTLVLFWGDHGVGLARAKRWLYDSGVRVPLIARWPGKIEPGSVRNDLVQFLDLPPTMLSVAGVKPPSYMHGRVILGPDSGAEPRYLYHARDRMDERYDMIRAVRDHRFKYIRNFESHKPWVQFMRTPSQGPIYQELGRLKKAGQLGPITALFMADTKPHEELYDVVADPYEVHNLADRPGYEKTLETMRAELIAWMRRTNDHGLIPEPEINRTMRPDGKRAVTSKPVASPSKASNGSQTVSLRTDPEGASIAYRIEAEGTAAQEKERWLLYSKPVTLSRGSTLRAIATRLGYEDSAEVSVKN